MNKNTICLWYDGDAEEAARFYARYGFTSCLDDALHLVLALSTVRQIILDAAP